MLMSYHNLGKVVNIWWYPDFGHLSWVVYLFLENYVNGEKCVRNEVKWNRETWAQVWVQFWTRAWAWVSQAPSSYMQRHVYFKSAYKNQKKTSSSSLSLPCVVEWHLASSVAQMCLQEQKKQKRPELKLSSDFEHELELRYLMCHQVTLALTVAQQQLEQYKK